MTRQASIVNEGNVRWAEHSHGEKFGYRRKSLSSAVGGEKLGCSLYEVPPGRRAWPYHYHGANEEASFSTMIEPDIMLYPDSGKVGVFVGAAPGGPKEKRTVSGFSGKATRWTTMKAKDNGLRAGTARPRDALCHRRLRGFATRPTGARPGTRH